MSVPFAAPGPIQAHAQRHGFHFTDCTATLTLTEMPGPTHCVRWPFDPHPNATAHQAFATTTLHALLQAQSPHHARGEQVISQVGAVL